MNLRPASPDYADHVRESFARQSMMTTLGAEIRSIAPGAVEVAAPILPQSRQQAGFGHGGLMFAIGDSAAGYSALSLVAPQAGVVTVEMKINFLAPGKGDHLIARGRVLRPGKRLIIVAASIVSVTAGVETEIAVLQGTIMPVAPEIP